MKANKTENLMIGEYKDVYQLTLNDNGKETIKTFETKKEAKAQLNKMVKSLMKMFSDLEKFYEEKTSWYELIILADKNFDEDEIVDGKNITLEIKLIEEETMEEE